MTNKVLVTGGCGYIGSHTLVELIEHGHTPVVLDNLSNSSTESLNRVRTITGHTVEFIEGDARDESLLDRLFAKHRFDCVIHFAGLKAVGESVAQPSRYYNNNVLSTLRLADACLTHNCGQFIFSSSATVYAQDETMPLTEASRTGPINPYGQSKLMCEQALLDIHTANPSFKVSVLRYFNPIGAHPSGLIGEDPNDIPNNLMPYVTQVAVGKLKQLSVFGSDYPTKDGTGVRDYIHVMDLAKGHVAAMNALNKQPWITVNLGTGNGYSVLEIVHAVETTSGKPVAYTLAKRRAGDVATCYSDPSLARTLLNWQAERDLSTMCADAWHWQQTNPNGYAF